MKKSNISKLISVLLVMVMVLTLGGCKDKDDSGAKEANTNVTTDASGTKKYEKFITVDVFSNQSNYQGIQSGWFAKVVKDKFNMELNIISPNISGGGDTLFQTRSATGDLGDLIMIGSENGRIADMVKAGLLLDLTDMIKTRTNVNQYQDAIKKLVDLSETDKVYGIPSEVSSQLATAPGDAPTLTFGAYTRWDYYQAIGSPKISTLEDLLPMLKTMQDTYPTSDSGKKAYALSFFKDWDGNMMNLAKQPTCLYGYDEVGFVLSKADGTDDQSIIDSDSQYMRVLKFYFDANQMGLVDPESSTQNYDTLFAKYQDGAVLYSPWPWLGQSAYNTDANKAAGKGFMVIPIEDQKVFSYGCNPTGKSYFIGIGTKAEDPERMMDFIDWLYSPEGIEMNCPQNAGAAGIEGLTWELKDGKPVLTDFGKQAFMDDATMPEEYGGGSFEKGISQLGFKPVLISDINPKTGSPYVYTLWDSVLAENNTPLDQSWQDANGGAKNVAELFTKTNQILIANGTNYVVKEQGSQIEALRNQCKAIIVEDSWKMIFAKDEEEFYKLQKHMQETVKGLGYDEVLAFDMKCAKEQSTARQEAAK